MLKQLDFWKGKRVLLTGHTGFKGSWLSIWLQRKGADVLGIALDPPTSPSLFQVARVAEGMQHKIIDIREYELLCEEFKRFEPEIVFHLAAQPLVRCSYRDPVDTYTTNVMGTVNLLEAVRQSKTVKAVVNVTTDKCYENREWIWGYRETEAMGGRDPYSSSKACSELVTSAYRESFLKANGIPVATARAGNVIGGGDWAEDRLVPDVLAALTNNVPVEIRNPEAIRPWQHVIEPLSGYMKLAESLFNRKDEFAEAWNFGPNDEDAKPVNWIVNSLCEAWPYHSGWNVADGYQPHEAHFLKLDNSKARNKLGWKPKWGLKETLSLIVDWHKAWLNNEDMKTVCLDQIKKYEV